MNIERTIIKILYFPRKFIATPGKNNAIIPAPIEAPQTGAPTLHACSAPKPKTITITPKIEAPLALAAMALSLIFLTKQVIVAAVTIPKTMPRIV